MKGTKLERSRMMGKLSSPVLKSSEEGRPSSLRQLLKENEFFNKRGLKSLRRKAEEGKIDIVYVNSPEDLAKEFKDQIILLGEFWKLGIEVIFASEKVRVSIPQNLICFRSNYGW